MAIRTGTDADLSIAAYNTGVTKSMFGSSVSGGSNNIAQLSYTRVTRWALHTHRQMVDVTPKDSDVTRWQPGPGGGFCAVRGWVEAEPDLGFDPGRYDVPSSTGQGLVVQLFFDLATPETGLNYKFDGRLEMLNVTVPIDGPQNFAAIIRVDSEIEVNWS